MGRLSRIKGTIRVSDKLVPGLFQSLCFGSLWIVHLFFIFAIDYVDLTLLTVVRLVPIRLLEGGGGRDFHKCKCCVENTI